MLRDADSYATLEFGYTYYLVFRDLPAIIRDHVSGNRAIDLWTTTRVAHLIEQECGVT